MLTLLLHSCCAPCSSYVLEYLSQYFEITVLYYNPNIYPDEEYWKRVKEQQEFIRKFPAEHPISFLEGAFEKERFYDTVRGVEQIPDRGGKTGAEASDGLFYHHIVDQPAEKCTEVKRDRRTACRRIRSGLFIFGF